MDPRDPTNPHHPPMSHPPYSPRPVPQPFPEPNPAGGAPPAPQKSGKPGKPGKTHNPSARFWRLVACIGIPVALIVGCATGAATTEAAQDTAQQASQTATKPPAGPPVREATPTPVVTPERTAQSVPAAKPAPVKPVDPEPVKIGNGVHQVGSDIEPGRYKTTGADADSFSGMCFWSRLKNDTGDFNDIITNDIVEGPGSMTVKPTDKFIEFSGDCTWVKQ